MLALLFKAALSGGAAADLFAAPVTVAGYTTPHGTFVAPYRASRKKHTAALAPGWGDLFSHFQDTDHAERAGPAAAGAGGEHRAVPESQAPAADTGDRWDALAARSGIGDAAEGLRRRAADNGWPEAFQAALATAIAALPQNMRGWISRQGRDFAIVHRASLDEVPARLRATYESAQAVCVNHSRIEFIEDRFPEQETLRHELTHLAWYQLSDQNRWGDINGPGKAQIARATAEATAAGEKMLAFAHSRAMRARATPPAPPGIDAFDWRLLHNYCASVRSSLKRYQGYQEKGHTMPKLLKESLELNLALPSDHLLTLAKHLGLPIHDVQLAEITLYQGYASKLGTTVGGAYTTEETVAYRAGVDPAFADELFSAFAPASGHAGDAR